MCPIGASRSYRYPRLAIADLKAHVLHGNSFTVLRAQARRHLRPILISGAVVGLLLALSMTVVTRWGRPWFALSLRTVVGVMMVCYVAVPSRLIGVKSSQSRRDKLAAKGQPAPAASP